MCRKRVDEPQQLECSECGKKFDGITEIPVDLGNGGILCLQCDYNESQSDRFADKSVKVADIFKEKEKEIEEIFLEPESEIGANGLRSWQHNENSY
jgi:hypothetical protein